MLFVDAINFDAEGWVAPQFWLLLIKNAKGRKRSNAVNAQCLIRARRIYQTLIRNEYANDWRLLLLFSWNHISEEYNRSSEFSYGTLICCRWRRWWWWCVRRVNNAIRLIHAYLVRKYQECELWNVYGIDGEGLSLIFHSFFFSFFAFAFILLSFVSSCVFEIERKWDKSPAITHVIERFDAWTVSACKVKRAQSGVPPAYERSKNKHIKIQLCCRVECRFRYIYFCHRRRFTTHKHTHRLPYARSCAYIIDKPALVLALASRHKTARKMKRKKKNRKR